MIPIPLSHQSFSEPEPGRNGYRCWRKIQYSPAMNPDPSKTDSPVQISICVLRKWILCPRTSGCFGWCLASATTATPPLEVNPEQRGHGDRCADLDTARQRSVRDYPGDAQNPDEHLDGEVNPRELLPFLCPQDRHAFSRGSSYGLHWYFTTSCGMVTSMSCVRPALVRRCPWISALSSASSNAVRFAPFGPAGIFRQFSTACRPGLPFFGSASLSWAVSDAGKHFLTSFAACALSYWPALDVANACVLAFTLDSAALALPLWPHAARAARHKTAAGSATIFLFIVSFSCQPSSQEADVFLQCIHEVIHCRDFRGSEGAAGHDPAHAADVFAEDPQPV